MHWSGAPDTETFLKHVISEPHPLDNDPEIKKMNEIMDGYTEQMVLALAVSPSKLMKLIKSC